MILKGREHCKKRYGIFALPNALLAGPPRPAYAPL